MNDKYVDFSGSDEFSDIVEFVIAEARLISECGFNESVIRNSLSIYTMWDQFCILVKNGLQLEGELENTVINWAREYNQGIEGTADVRIE